MLDEKHYYQADEPNSIDTPDKKYLYFMGGTITTAIDYAIKLGCKDILLIADNTVHSKDFQDCVNIGIIELAKHCNLYKWTEDGNFSIPYKNIKDFI